MTSPPLISILPPLSVPQSSALLLPLLVRLTRITPPEMMMSPLESSPSASRATLLTTVMLPPLT